MESLFMSCPARNHIARPELHVQTRKSCVIGRKDWGTRDGGGGGRRSCLLVVRGKKGQLEFVFKCQHHMKICKIIFKIRHKNPPGSSGLILFVTSRG